MISPSLRALVGASIGIAGIVPFLMLRMAVRPVLRVVKQSSRGPGQALLLHQPAFDELAEVKRPLFLSRAAKY
jgi:hypothetical protein